MEQFAEEENQNTSKHMASSLTSPIKDIQMSLKCDAFPIYQINRNLSLAVPKLSRKWEHLTLPMGLKMEIAFFF